MSRPVILAVDVVGAASSAGQAALYLSRFAKQVVLVVRAATLADTMSRYLVERITSAPNVEVRYRSELVSAGDVRLDSMKRVASAVGEGAMSIHFVHRYLATT